MSNNFVNAIEKDMAWKATENGQPALNTTFDSCLDLFSTVGALRNRDIRDIENKIAAAYGEDPLTTMKLIFYARDIEEGLGERRFFRIALKYIANRHTKDIIINIPNIVKYGRFDDLYELVGTPAESEAFKFIKTVWDSDIEAYENNKPISLMAKWLKSVNTSSKESNLLGKLTAKNLGLSERNYRKSLSLLRTRLNVLEKNMSNNEWDIINFSSVPGGAMKKYVKAFYRHQENRFKEYLEALKSGKKVKVGDKEVTAKINTKHLYPYEILEKYHSGSFRLGYIPYVEEIEAMWNGLKDWIEGVESNTIIIADTSASMNGRPLATSVGLGIYFAERNTGAFHNKFMTFSSKPSWISFKDNCSLSDKLNNIPAIVSNTNLEAAFDLILNTALRNHISQEDMPKNLVIITDMEFDQCVVDNFTNQNTSYWNCSPTKMTFYDSMKNKYANAGYILPEITFWNVNARNDTYHTTKNKPHVRMVSGQSPSVFKSLIDGKTHTPYEFMLEVLYKDRYESVLI